MNKMNRLGWFGLLAALFIGEGIGLFMFFFNRLDKEVERHMRESQKVKLALVIVTFHSYYHVWPCPPGVLDASASTELGGDEEAKINTQHINFFKKNSCDNDLTDEQGHAFFFKPDDSIGTCSVYSESSDNK